MRVYDVYEYPIGTKLTLKAQFDRVRAFLRDNGLSDRQLMYEIDVFCRRGHGEIRPEDLCGFEDCFKRHPPMRDYPFVRTCDNDILCTNMGNDGRMIAPAPQTLDGLIAKIPRPLNPGIAVFRLCGIPFGEISSPILPARRNRAEFEPFCSSIELHHDGVFPRNRRVKMIVDVTGDANPPRPSLPYANALAEYLPNAWNARQRLVRLDDTERAAYAKRAEQAQEDLAQVRMLCQDASSPLQLPDHLYSMGYSLAAPLKKQLAPLGFAFAGYRDFTYSLRKRAAHGHDVLLEVFTAPSCRRIDPILKFSGLGFHFEFPLPSHVPADQADANRWCECLRDFLFGGILDALDRLGRHFLDTPDWFFSSPN